MRLGPNHTHPEKSIFVDVCTPFPRQGGPPEKKVSLGVRLKSTRPSHGRVCWSLYPPEARHHFLLAGLLRPAVPRQKKHVKNPSLLRACGPRTWRESPCFHADLPGFGFAFCVRDRVFFSPAWAKKNWGPFLAPKPFFSAKTVF